MVTDTKKDEPAKTERPISHEPASYLRTLRATLGPLELSSRKSEWFDPIDEIDAARARGALMAGVARDGETVCIGVAVLGDAAILSERGRVALIRHLLGKPLKTSDKAALSRAARTLTRQLSRIERPLLSGFTSE